MQTPHCGDRRAGPPHTQSSRARVSPSDSVVGVVSGVLVHVDVVWCVVCCGVCTPALLMRAQNWRRNFLQAGGGSRGSLD